MSSHSAAAPIPTPPTPHVHQRARPVLRPLLQSGVSLIVCPPLCRRRCFFRPLPLPPVSRNPRTPSSQGRRRRARCADQKSRGSAIQARPARHRATCEPPPFQKAMTSCRLPLRHSTHIPWNITTQTRSTLASRSPFPFSTQLGRWLRGLAVYVVWLWYVAVFVDVFRGLSFCGVLAV